MTAVATLLHETFPSRDGEAAPYLAFPEAAGDAYAAPPMIPFDVFAIAGRLLELSGAYHHIAPPNRERAKRLLGISAEEIAEARAVAVAWRRMDGFTFMNPAHAADYATWRQTPDGRALDPLFAWWNELFARHGAAHVVDGGRSDHPPPGWWRPALRLFIAADEAAEGIGFNPAVPPKGAASNAPWFERFVNLIFLFVGSTMSFEADGTAETSAISTLSAAEKSVVCVLPKARTPAIGCTMRSLSHNLALMPPQGIATGRWMPYVFTDAPPDERHLNLLLIPFPYTIAASAFRPRNDDIACGQRGGFFGLDQKWLERLTPATLVEFVVALAQEAVREVDRIHAVVFPELALDESFYQALVEQLPAALKGLEFLVAGVSNLGERIGNFVNVTVFQAQGGEASATGLGFTSTREKHHRWRLDRDQIIGYGLQGTLSPSLFWWEDIDLLSRRVDFAVIRSGSVISALICEDLARVDPCQELIRSVGPSIIFALLMDAPQIKERWPARHATILAEDPGSAVLTMTSKAMMNRQDRLGIYPSKSDKDRVIALWRDDSKPTPEEILCGKGQHGVLLTLSGGHVLEESLDGRQTSAAISWRFAGQRQLGLAGREQHFSDVLGDENGQVEIVGP